MLGFIEAAGVKDNALRGTMGFLFRIQVYVDDSREELGEQGPVLDQMMSRSREAFKKWLGIFINFIKEAGGLKVG